jgi:hypothetical protein
VSGTAIELTDFIFADVSYECLSFVHANEDLGCIDSSISFVSRRHGSKDTGAEGCGPV